MWNFIFFCLFLTMGWSQGLDAAMESEQTPKFLYKIITLRNWQATQSRKTVSLSADDDRFIHLAKEDQLERIITKYWSKESNFVILKLDTDKLVGDLIYETNPQGSTKFYHLYRGYIPFRAIVETKIHYGEMPPSKEQSKLKIVSAGDAALRNGTKQLTRDEILSPEIQTLIKEMTITMREAPGVGLAAPQVGMSFQIVVIEDMDLSHLTKEQRQERERDPVAFHVLVNPKITPIGNEVAEFFEGCLSIPGYLGIVPRAKSVRVEALNEKAEPVVIDAKGWYARILQHEIDHLQGTLYTDRCYMPSLMTEENYIFHWKGRSVPEIKASLTRKL